ncbi:E3 ubiquitin-protein ligase MPSR1-like [Zingiber officinale]|uniref:RING-type domain-containing protein n=1 Tax=Zingiber officinale TaxID=94328 RepID=A0A8J5L7E5_ZINOF|nr:E3 ubiquitin-protein ligase MPSR1-like [Zingiber officinale]KAG6503560.1 hypothetical protein ZIOFF_035876 [Zingiber officinale]
MAAEAESVRLEEIVRRGIAFFPFFFDVVGTDDAASELERLVIFNPLSRRVVVLQSDPGIIHSLMSSDPEAGGPPPASEASIEALRVVDPVEIGAEEECPVCLEWMRGHEAAYEEEVVREMPCGHRFHGRCIEKWLGMRGSCPLCRYQMPAAEEEPKKVGGEESTRSREVFVTITFGRMEGEEVSQQQQQEEGQREAQ